MLYYLSYLTDFYSPLNLFRYITVRATVAAIAAFILSLVFGRFIIAFLKARKVHENSHKSDSKKLSEMHSSKSETPTMGGLIIMFSFLLSVLLCAKLGNIYVLLVLFTGLFLAILGFMDDYIKLMFEDRDGLRAKTKLFFQILLGCIVAVILYLTSDPDKRGLLAFPFYKHALDIGIGYIFFTAVVIVSSSNGVNLTDGLDGLATGCSVLLYLSFMIICYIVGRIDFSGYLHILYIPGAGEIAIVCAALVGSTLGFLWFNCHPAEIFMGDTGALSLGGMAGIIAVIIKKEYLLLIVGGIFVAEALSVVLQVLSFKLFGKRVFRIAPLHHHFQFGGLSESKITIRFWIVAAILALFSICTLKIR